LYDRMPNLFSDDDLYELEEQARAIGLDWRPAPEQAEFSLRRTVKQAVMGFVGGSCLALACLPRGVLRRFLPWAVGGGRRSFFSAWRRRPTC